MPTADQVTSTRTAHQKHNTKRLRFVTATALFDGHDASINIIRRMLVSAGCEVVHLGHNRSVDEIVTAALQEDANAVAVSSYQGGHMEFFLYMLERLRAAGAGQVKVFGGGGGVILPTEIEALHAAGVTRIYTPQDGQKLGLTGMIADMVERTSHAAMELDLECAPSRTDQLSLSRFITRIEDDSSIVFAPPSDHWIPVIGITGTGGAGKSSLLDEIIRRFRTYTNDALQIAVLAIDPGRRKSGGSLLGDRIRMNALYPRSDGSHAVFVRSLALHESGVEVPHSLPRVIDACKAANYDFIFVETIGTGQHDAYIAQVADFTIYVMTPEYGASSQLEKIDMLDFADIVVINKFDRRGAEDAYRDVCKQVQRNRAAFGSAPEDMPVFGTIAARFNDQGVTAVYRSLHKMLAAKGMQLPQDGPGACKSKTSILQSGLIAPNRHNYLSNAVESVRQYKSRVRAQAEVVREVQHLEVSKKLISSNAPEAVGALDREIRTRRTQIDPESETLLQKWPATFHAYRQNELEYEVRGQKVRVGLYRESLSGTKIPRVSVPTIQDHGRLLEWLMLENLPGHFPFTAGVFPLKRENEDPTRMFAGEGGPQQTNARFHLLSKNQSTARLSTAFDSVTLYGNDPAERPDIFGKIGNSGVSIATVEDMAELYAGFDLCAPSTSVSMTINGPAPTILAMFFNVAIDRQVARFRESNGRDPDPPEYAGIRARALSSVRGTVQADILKEDQGQNTCLFSTEFSLKCMGDVQEFFIRNNIRNFYSVSVSGYHIAEAGANPITQLAFTLANAFTLVEIYLQRGMRIDDFAPHFSFFFSNGMDPEYSVIGRVARRIWAIVMRDRYKANSRSQMLKYHVQTSGRSLHAQELLFNDIRTTLQALIAVYDNCNSLHTNASDEAITTPTRESVRRALAIQMIINREWGVAKNENVNQGSFFLEELTELVEEAVLDEFERISARGGVLGAMETGYQRSKIQDESIKYEHLKLSGAYPIIGVNTFLEEDADESTPESAAEVTRSSDQVKLLQIARLKDFQARHANESPVWLARLKEAASANENVFEVLMDAVKCCSLGQITEKLCEAGGQYRRNL